MTLHEICPNLDDAKPGGSLKLAEAVAELNPFDDFGDSVKDGIFRHIFSGMNPQGVSVASFKQPTDQEAAHDFLWRAHARTPAMVNIVIFNRSHYEDVLVVRVHHLVPRDVWSGRYRMISDFEAALTANATRILKVFLHISLEKQLEGFRERLGDKAENWKISEADYAERKLWDEDTEAYEELLAKTSTEAAPWYIIPSDKKWFRNLATAEIIASTLEDMQLHLPAKRVDLEDIRRRYCQAEERGGTSGSGADENTG